MNRFVAETKPDLKVQRGESLALILWGLWLVAIEYIQWPVWIYETFPKFNKANAFMDAAVFAVAGDLLRHGGAPYLSYWDHKPPLIHMINAVGLGIANGGLWGIWILSLAALLAALLLGYMALRSAFGVPSALVGMTFFVGALPAVWAPDVTEEYVLPLQWAAVLLLVRWKGSHGQEFRGGCFLGALVALGFLLRPNLIGTMGAIIGVFSVLLLLKRDFAALRNFVLGVLTAFVGIGILVISYLSVEGALVDFWDQVFHYNFIYASNSWKLRLRVAYDGLFAATLYAPLLLPAAGWLLALYRLRGPFENITLQAPIMLAVIWLPVELLMDCLAGREYGHYFIPLLAPMSFLTAFLIAEVVPIKRFGSFGLPPAAVALAAALMVVPVASTMQTLKDKGLRPKRLEVVAPLVQYIHEHTSQKASIFIWGQAPDLYFLSHRRPATRFIYPFPLLTVRYADDALVQRLLDDFADSPPEIIIDMSGQNDGEREMSAEQEPTGEGLVPKLSTWNPDWRHPDPRQPEFSWWGSRPSWWAMSPAMKRFYDYVAARYTPVDYVGPRKWVVYAPRE